MSLREAYSGVLRTRGGTAREAIGERAARCRRCRHVLEFQRRIIDHFRHGETSTGLPYSGRAMSLVMGMIDIRHLADASHQVANRHRPENRTRFSESTMRSFKDLPRPLCVLKDARRCSAGSCLRNNSSAVTECAVGRKQGRIRRREKPPLPVMAREASRPSVRLHRRVKLRAAGSLLQPPAGNCSCLFVATIQR
ncbi:hypothetical protein ABIA20_000972 [Sinorhizobium fredii]